MSRSLARRIYSDAFAKWPKQDLRPDYQLQDVLRRAVEERYASAKPSEPEELLKARALQFLVQNKFRDRYKLKGPMLEPKSQPTYFEDLVREIEEAPRRTWLERLGKRLSGIIRLQ
ncbi:DNA-directed RNA polymerase III [Purpureocillium lavendulum]|uniref:DNA-directed RNA polymerase III n=1 Tax=Purpureocillium lavendulum TaxID=1247861 RepID=A0AB34FYK7_9HYPO|nr:DNA-directed RNA polymerase III [Purpureocillium lavendulum]